MLQPTAKQDFLADLSDRVLHNREKLLATFEPLGSAQRAWQPAPAEWSADQCFEHLTRAFNFYAPKTAAALNRQVSASADGVYRPSFWARRLIPWQFDPQKKIKTMPAMNPTSTSIPEALPKLLDQQEELLAMIERSASANLQTMCWLIKGLPIRFNLGDYLIFLVSHDELHIGQAERVLAAYAQQGDREPS